MRERAQAGITTETAQRVQVRLYDVLGREVRMLLDGQLAALAPRSIAISASDLPGGVYFVRIQSDRGAVTRAVTLAR